MLISLHFLSSNTFSTFLHANCYILWKMQHLKIPYLNINLFCCMLLKIGVLFVRASMVRIAVDFVPPVIIPRAWFWTAWSLCVTDLGAVIWASLLYWRIGFTNTLYVVFNVFLELSNFVLASLFKSDNCFLLSVLFSLYVGSNWDFYQDYNNNYHQPSTAGRWLVSNL